MSGDLTPRPASDVVVNPLTGEITSLNSPTDLLAEWLYEMRRIEQDMRVEKLKVAWELHERMDAEAQWTVTVGRWKVTGESPNRVDYDAEHLMAVLTELFERGAVTQRAVADAVETVVTFKVKTRGVNQLLKLGGDVADAIRGCQIRVTRERRITVKQT